MIIAVRFSIGGGGLVDSREFINLRCWQLIENGHIVVESDASPSCETTTLKLLPISKRDTELHEEKMNMSTLSLSKSLGAKVLSENEMQSSSNRSTKNMADDADEFVDACETTHDDSDINTTTTITRDGQLLNSFCDKMYIVSGASIKCDRYPCNSSYTR